jgi:hypothetical protein
VGGKFASAKRSLLHIELTTAVPDSREVDMKIMSCICLLQTLFIALSTHAQALRQHGTGTVATSTHDRLDREQCLTMEKNRRFGSLHGQHHYLQILSFTKL